jgi:hypothetical protein
MLQQAVYIVPTVLSSVNKNLVRVDWILMAQVRVQRWALVNPVIDLRFQTDGELLCQMNEN